jgi:hypothetical protein
MTAPHCPAREPLDTLVMLTGRPPESLSCNQLTEIVRLAHALSDRGITRTRLRLLSREYARRLDQLGPDEFDRRSLIGA